MFAEADARLSVGISEDGVAAVARAKGWSVEVVGFRGSINVRR